MDRVAARAKAESGTSGIRRSGGGAEEKSDGGWLM